MLYVGRDGLAVEFGNVPLRFKRSRGGDTPVTIRNAEGRLLYCLLEKVPRPANLPRSTRTHLRDALRAAGCQSALIGYGTSLCFDVWPRVDPELLDLLRQQFRPRR